MALKRDGALSAAALRKRAAESDEGIMPPEIDSDRRQILGGIAGAGQELIPPSPTPETPPRPAAAPPPPVLDHDTAQAVSQELTPATVLERVDRLWRSSMDNFVEIGRVLNRAAAAWPAADEFKRRILDHLPFGDKVAFQLKAVARAVDQQLLAADELPNGYSTAYQLTTLTRDEIAEARRRGLLDRDLTRARIIEFKRAIRSRLKTDPGSGTGAVAERIAAYDEARRKRDELIERRAELERAIVALDAAIAESERRLVEIMGQST